MHFDQRELTALKNQDPKAVKAWYLYCFAGLMAQASRFFTQENEQLTAVHNTLLKALKNIDQFQANTSMQAWLAVILRNELIDTYRRKQRWRILSFEKQEYELHEPKFDSELDEPAEWKRIESLLALLPQKTRFLFGLYAFEDMKPREIATQLSMDVQTVNWHLKIAKQRLKKHLES